MNTSGKAIFIDKDGTLLENVSYNVDTSLVRFTPGALSALRIWQKNGYKLFVITNQPGVARGLFDESDVLRIKEHIIECLRDNGIYLNGFYYCPHHPEGKVEVFRRV